MVALHTEWSRVFLFMFQIPYSILCKYQIGLKVKAQFCKRGNWWNFYTNEGFVLYFFPSLLGLAEALYVVLVFTVSGTVAKT